MHRYEEALTSFNRVIEITPEDYKAWYHRSKALANLGYHYAALASLDKTLAINSQCYYALNYRGTLLKKLGRYEDAIASFDESLEIKPNHPDAWYNKARCYALLGNLETALNYLHQALKLNPTLYRAIAKIDSDFNAFHHNPRFCGLINPIQSVHDNQTVSLTTSGTQRSV